MQPKPMIVVAKHSIVITPTLFDLAQIHARVFIDDRQTKLNQHLRDRGSYRAQAPKRSGQPADPITLQSQIRYAESLVRAVEPAKAELVRIYDLNFQAMADVLRNARIQLGLDRIEQMHSLKVVLNHMAQTLKEINPTFSREKFIQHINEGGTSL